MTENKREIKIQNICNRETRFSLQTLIQGTIYSKRSRDQEKTPKSHSKELILIDSVLILQLNRSAIGKQENNSELHRSEVNVNQK